MKRGVMSKVIISADSTCDIGKDLAEKYNIKLIDWKIEVDGKLYLDNVDITPDEMYRICREKNVLPKSSGANPEDYKSHFKPLLDEGYEVVHLGLGSGISHAYHSSEIAAEELGDVYTVDSQNLSSGLGLLVIKAAELAAEGLSAKEIQQHILAMVPKSHASFLLDTLEFMSASGRCSNIAAAGASMLKIKPCIEVDTSDGSKMHTGKMYRGSLEKGIRKYTKDKLEGRTDLDTSRVFITHSEALESDIAAAREAINELQKFDEVHVTKANCTISVHCGPRTLGVLFMTK